MNNPRRKSNAIANAVKAVLATMSDDQLFSHKDMAYQVVERFPEFRVRFPELFEERPWRADDDNRKVTYPKFGTYIFRICQSLREEGLIEYVQHKSGVGKIHRVVAM